MSTRGKRCVYVMFDGFAVKVGVTGGSPEGRRRMLQVGNPHTINVLYASVPLSVYTAFGIERTFHADFQNFRMEAEWFECDPEHAVEVVKEMVAKELFKIAA